MHLNFNNDMDYKCLSITFQFPYFYFLGGKYKYSVSFLRNGPWSIPTAFCQSLSDTIDQDSSPHLINEWIGIFDPP